MESSDEKKILKSAMYTFLGCASLVIATALIYCISTQNYLATGLISGVAALIGGLAVYLLKSEK